jgi:hypothetical protein
MAVNDRNPAPEQVPDKPEATAGAAIVRDDSGFYEPYAEFAKSVRTWFIAFGVGAPVLFLINRDAGERLVKSGSAEFVAYAFLFGVAVQVLAAILYKTAMWYLYMGELDPAEQNRWLHKASEWLSDQYWIEFAVDAITFVSFAWATLTVVQLFVS